MRKMFATWSLPGVMLAAMLAVLVGESIANEKKELPVALEGNCAVCLIDGGAVAKGSTDYAVEFDGKTYLFPDAGTQAKFEKNPAKYVPALNGDCTVCYVNGGVRAPGKLAHRVMYKKRLYLFPNEAVKKKFEAAPEKYENADLAYGGNCAICLIKGGNESPGSDKYVAIYDGMRYKFPNAALLKAFKEDPAPYAVKKGGKAETSSTSSPKKELVDIQGRSACAACEFKVHPTQNPEVLGLAVVVNDQEIYVIEKAHKNYSKIYDGRFDGLQLAVKGKVLKKKGRFTWVEPESVKVVQ